jgi:hypothetical protein
LTQSEQAEKTAAPRPHRRRNIVLAVIAGVLVLTALVGLSLRYGVVSPQARQFIEARTDGLAVGRLGN